jgi:isoamylase
MVNARCNGSGQSGNARLSAFSFGHAYAVTARSFLAFGLSAEENTPRRLRQSVDAILDVTEVPLS